jgi:hypothetical protein
MCIERSNCLYSMTNLMPLFLNPIQATHCGNAYYGNKGARSGRTAGSSDGRKRPPALCGPAAQASTRSLTLTFGGSFPSVP